MVLQKVPDQQSVFLRVNGTGGINQSAARFDGAGGIFQDGLLEYPQYTKPVDYRGWKVPEILVSGHHANIARWRRKEALRRTLKCRPDLLAKLQMTAEDKKLMAEIAGEEEES